ncbi:hypothetical protein [Pyrodictium abyssi]|uniref:hypothetical protein n=1 Tax=Pyrodictium abyssi TaxID=54256 RepID=UPI0030C6E597
MAVARDRRTLVFEESTARSIGLEPGKSYVVVEHGDRVVLVAAKKLSAGLLDALRKARIRVEEDVVGEFLEERR